MCIVIIDSICDEEEETPLHLRVTRNRPTPAPHLISDIPIRPINTVDEYVISIWANPFSNDKLL